MELVGCHRGQSVVKYRPRLYISYAALAREPLGRCIRIHTVFTHEELRIFHLEITDRYKIRCQEPGASTHTQYGLHCLHLDR